MIAYKFLRADGTSPFTGFRWRPESEQSEWVEAAAEPCRSGIHACRADDLPFWLAPDLHEIELAGEIVEGGRKLVAARARLLGRIELWDDERSDRYVRMCADRAHYLAQSAAPRLDEWEATVEPAIPQGPAVLGFVAAAIAEQVSGRDGFIFERARQSEWLIENLELRE